MKIQSLLVTAAMLAVGGCDVLAPPPPVPMAPMAPMGAATLTTATKAPFGPYVVDGSGRSVYVLEGSRGMSGINRCSGQCLGVWPPLAASGSPVTASGLDPAQVRLVSGYTGGQVSYAGWPLYRYHHDMAPGQTTGQGVRDQWGTWYLMRPSGEPIRPGY
jgi:predicted lipoprotein with Yx(FWY)xxD motif